MGMYTEFHYNTELKKDIPEHILDILRFMTGDKEGDPTELPDHPFFRTKRWRWLLTQDSYYFSADTHSTLRKDLIACKYVLCIRCNVKNYDDEIEHFINWMYPYIDKYDGDFLGFFRYEENEVPVLIHKGWDYSKSYDGPLVEPLEERSDVE